MSFDDPDTFMMEPRPAAEVAKRCIVLCCVASHSDDSSLFFEDWLKEEGIWPEVSPEEAEFLVNPIPDRRANINASWRKESFLMLMWCLNKIDPLPPPVQIEDSTTLLLQIPRPGEKTARFIEGAMLRPFGEIVSAYESVYDDHWKVRDARSQGQNPPQGVESGVIYERHYALNWLRKYGIFSEQSWDEITTDT